MNNIHISKLIISLQILFQTFQVFGLPADPSNE